MLSISDISIRLAGRLLIDQTTVQIAPGARVGLVGRNGTGKSTLFRAIRGELATESGTITIPPRWCVGSLAQEAPDGPQSLVEITAARGRHRARPAPDRRNPDPPGRYRRAFGPCPRGSNPERARLLGRRPGAAGQ